LPQVPYNPVPQVAAQSDATPKFSVNAPGAAFGTDVAQAGANLGKSIEGAGNELFTRAVAMQDLFNHSEANQADTDFMVKAGEIHAKLSAMQGKDAVDYFANGYQQDLKSAREEVRGTLSNGMSQKLFDQSSLSTFGRTVFNGASHAASANKSYAIGGAAARVQASRDAALQNPTDEAGFQQHVQETVANTEAQYKLKGADPDTIANATHKAVSDLWYDRIAGLARTQPYAANKMLQDATKDGKIAGEDLGKITTIVRGAMHTAGARNISNEVRSGSDLSWGSKVVPMASAKNAIGSFESGNNYQSLGVEVFDKNGNSRGRALGKYQVMPENLAPWLRQAGLPPMTPAEFLNSPSAQDKVFETVFGAEMQKYGNFNDAASVWFSGKPVAQAGNKVRDANGTSVPGYLLATNRHLAQNAPLQDQMDAARTRATALSPDDPLLGDYAVNRVIADHNTNSAAKRDFDYNNRQAVEGVLVSGGAGGKLPTSVDDIKNASPQAEAAWNNLTPDVQRRYMSVLAKNAKGDTAWTNEKLTEYQRLKGMAQSDPAGFLDQDIVGMDLPLSARKELVNLQVSKKANAEQDPRVLHALSLLRPTLAAANLSATSNKDDYYRFVGSLQGAMEDYATQNKKPADAKAIQEIGQRLLQQQAGTGWFGTNIGANKLYQVDVPEAEKTKILNDPYWTSKGITPTDDMIQRIYTRQTYQKLYGGTPKTQTTTADNTPKPPISR
jgi:hypothetical protein